jgi:hypothetical protein
LYQRFIHQRELRNYLLQRDWDVFGTLKFQNKRLISGKRAHRELLHFWNRLDRVVYGKAAEVGCRVQRWCFAHIGSHNDNYHLHFVARAPIDPGEFAALANTLWTKQCSASANLKENWITPVIYPDRIAWYVTKETWKIGADSFDANLSADTGVTYQMNTERALAQEQRIARAMTANERQAAKDALKLHKAGTLLRLALREQKLSGKATGE